MNKKVILRGMSAILPLCIGDFPFSFIVGALSVSAGMSIWQSTAWSTIVIAGSAQMLALNMLKTGASLGVIIFTTLIINLRHVLYSASISSTVREASFFKKCFMAYALTDEVYATTVKEMEENKKDKYLFYFSAMLTFWFAWVLADFLGALVGASFPHIEKYVWTSRWSPHLSPSWSHKSKARPAPSPPLLLPYPGYFWSYCPTR